MAGPSPGAGANAGNAIAKAIREGTTKSGALAAFRQIGGAIRTQRWYQLWTTVEDAIRTRPSVTSLPANRIPGADAFTPWATHKPGKFAYSVTVQIRDLDSDTIVNQPSTVFYDRRVSIRKALADVMGRVEEAYEGEGDYEGYRVEGGVVTGLYETVPIDEGGDDGLVGALV